MTSTSTLKKSVVVLLALMMIVVGTGCSNTAKTTAVLPEDTIFLPETYYDYFGDSPAEDVNTVKQLGEQYGERVYRRKGGVIIKADSIQRANLRSRTQDWITYYTDLLHSQDDDYHLEGSEDYCCLTLYYDEDLDKSTQNEIIQGLSYYYCLNQLFNGAGENWKLDITVKDCDTNKTVAHATIPHSEINVDTITWPEDDAA